MISIFSDLLEDCMEVFMDNFTRRFIKNFNKITLPLSKLLQKDVDFAFDVEIRDKKGAKNAVADHLSRLEREVDLVPCLRLLKKHPELIKKDLKVMPNIIYGMILIYGDYVIIKCISEPKIQSVPYFCHSASRRGYYGLSQTARKVLDCGFYWSPIFRDAHEFVSTYDQCQKAGMAISRRHEMPQ
ncbi:putative mitochondrial protein, partial [Mucuna pruriens]